MTEKKLLGRKTGWCNFPSTDDPKGSHAICDGIWNVKDDITYYCACECHDLAAKKAKNAKKYKRSIREVKTCSDHPTYKGIRKPRKQCKVCWDLYYKNNPDKKSFRGSSVR